MSRGAGAGIQGGLKNHWSQGREGSNPSRGTNTELNGFSETELWAADFFF
jgi:hypothetical protein